MAMIQQMKQGWSHPLVAHVLAALGIAAVGIVDYLTGVEYRVYPLYFLPLSWAAWHLGWFGMVLATALSTAVWGGFNYAAGMHYSSDSVWVVNLFTQAAAFVVVGTLIVRLRDSLERVTNLSRSDPLTGLPNIRAFREAARQSFDAALRYAHPITLAYIDLDNFKVVNDSLGHKAGDDLLMKVADLLRVDLRAGDIPARLGGDEFALLLPETGLDAAQVVLNRLHSRLTDALGQSPGPVTASIGAATLLKPARDVDDFIRRADNLMYSAKSAGKNRVHVEVVDQSPALDSQLAKLGPVSGH